MLAKVAVKFIMATANFKSSALLLADNYPESQSMVLTFIMLQASVHFSCRQLCFIFMAFLDLVQV